MKLIIDKKVIEELSVMNVNNIRVVNVQTLIENSKEVEVVDMAKTFNDAIRDRHIDETVAQALNRLGYQIIKIK